MILYHTPLEKGKISAANLLLKSDVNLDAMCNIDTSDDTIIELGSTVLPYLYGCHLEKLTLIAFNVLVRTTEHASLSKTIAKYFRFRLNCRIPLPEIDESSSVNISKKYMIKK